MHNEYYLITGKDGNQWFCHDDMFIDLQVSESGWGNTEIEAILNFLEKKAIA